MEPRTPKYRLHKPSGRAVVTIDGHDFYLGKYGTPESQAEYDRLIGEWLANGRRLPVARTADLSVNELLLAYLRWAEGYYGDSAELPNMRFSIRQLKALYGHTPAQNFGPLALKAVREAMIRANLCRKEINKRVLRIIRVFRWGVENELLPANVLHALKAVSSLRHGRSEARESNPVKPVPEAFVDAIQPHVLPAVWAMIELQRLTGCRPGEIVAMRGCDLSTSGNVWTYTPEEHKTAHRGHRRTIFIGPRAQAVLKPWLKADLQAYLFSPCEASEAYNAERREHRKSPVPPSHRLRKRKSAPGRAPKERYSVQSYGRAITRGCAKADRQAHKDDPSIEAGHVAVPAWHPHQLRHNAATWLRREFGLDVARVILGHRSAAVTEIYAEIDFARAIDVMNQVG